VVVAGDSQSGVVGSELPTPLVVRVLDSAGVPISDQLVNFVVTVGGGHVFAGASLTNADGLSQERWTLGTSVADSQRVAARAVDNTTGQPLTYAEFRATARAGLPQSVNKVRGDHQEGPVGTPLADSLTVRVADKYGNPVNGITVAWSSIRGGGTLNPSASTTDGSGLAATEWSPADTGADSVTATAPAMPSVFFGASAFLVLRYTQVATGWDVSCGLSDAGAAYCWGSDIHGALGTAGTSATCFGGLTCSPKPVPVGGGLTFSTVATNGEVSCGLSSGSAYCWGTNFYGLLGNGTWSGSNPPPQFTPMPVSGGLQFTAIATSIEEVCALATGGAIYCWGGLGTPAHPDSANVPTAVGNGLTFQSVTVANDHACGLTVGGAAYCWGRGDVGQLGYGGTSDTTAPALVAGGLTFTSITAGSSHTCGLVSGGAAYCWGAGAVGDTAKDFCPPQCNLTPQPVSGGVTFAHISAGEAHTCALTVSGAAYCWGTSGYGVGSDLGDGTNASHDLMTPVAGGLSFVSISGGLYFTCGITTAGDAYCWGANYSGQLGNGSLSDSNQPVKVTHP